MEAFGALTLLARGGFLVKGLLYIMIGALAFQVAVSSGGRVTGRGGALRAALEQPFGGNLLLIAAVGLFGYAAWRILQGVFDSDRWGYTWRGLGMRASFVARGIIHAILGQQAFRVYQGLSAASGNSERKIASEAFQWPLGDWFIVLAGVGLIGFAVGQVYAAIKCRLARDLDVQRLQREAGEWAVGVSRFGIAARAVVFALVGWTLIVAGWSRDASEVGNTTSSLRTLARQPEIGQWLLGIAAAGFVAYGLYQIIHARYLHIRDVHLASR